MRNFLVFLGLLTIIFGSISFSEAKIIYRWVDENGSVHYSPTKPWGVNYESINTAYSASQREMIDDARKQKELQNNIDNKEKILEKKKAEEQDLLNRLEICVDITYDKMSYQKRRIEDNSIKEKIDCEYKFNKKKQKSKYDNCILKIENKRIIEQSKLEEVVNNCFTDDISPELRQKVMDNRKEKEKHLQNINK